MLVTKHCLFQTYDLRGKKGILDKSFLSEAGFEPASPNSLLLPCPVNVVNWGDDSPLFLILIWILVGPFDSLGEYCITLHRAIAFYSQLRGSASNDPHSFLHGYWNETERAVGRCWKLHCYERTCTHTFRYFIVNLKPTVAQHGWYCWHNIINRKDKICC